MRREVILSNVAFGVGLSAAVLAAASYVLARPSPTPARASQDWHVAATPTNDGRGGAVAWGGRF